MTSTTLRTIDDQSTKENLKQALDADGHKSMSIIRLCIYPIDVVDDSPQDVAAHPTFQDLDIRIPIDVVEAPPCYLPRHVCPIFTIALSPADSSMPPLHDLRTEFLVVPPELPPPTVCPVTRSLLADMALFNSLTRALQGTKSSTPPSIQLINNSPTIPLSNQLANPIFICTLAFMLVLQRLVHNVSFSYVCNGPLGLRLPQFILLNRLVDEIVNTSFVPATFIYALSFFGLLEILDARKGSASKCFYHSRIVMHYLNSFLVAKKLPETI
eukprot:Gb_24758 [translate_table: standard]